MILRVRLKVFTKKIPDNSKLVKETSNMLGISARYKDCCEKKNREKTERILKNIMMMTRRATKQNKNNKEDYLRKKKQNKKIYKKFVLEYVWRRKTKTKRIWKKNTEKISIKLSLKKTKKNKNNTWKNTWKIGSQMYRRKPPCWCVLGNFGVSIFIFGVSIFNSIFSCMFERTRKKLVET